MTQHANPTRYHRHRLAVAMSRYWWNRYRSLPSWRWLARREAREQAELWGLAAKYSHEERI